MTCYTVVEVNLPDDAIHRKARKALKLQEEGALSERDAARVKREVGVIAAQEAIRKLDPRAVIRRVGDKLTITVQR